jgi:hypothetical protein
MRACTDAEPPVVRPAEGIMVRCIRAADPVAA